MMLWQRIRPLKQVQELDLVVLLMSSDHPVGDVDVDR
jgi:hypothetical protein